MQVGNDELRDRGLQLSRLDEVGLLLGKKAAPSLIANCINLAKKERTAYNNR